MNIRDSYLHGVDGRGVVKSLFFATAADVQANNALNINDLVFQLADTSGTQVPLTIPTLNQNTTGYASQILTVKKENGASYYLTFVDSNNTTASNESVYTDAGIQYNPSTNVLTVGAISGPTIQIGNTTLYLDSSGTTNKLTPDTSITNSSTHGTIPSSKAVYDAIIAGIGANDAMIFKGFLTGGDSAANTTYTPAADKGHTYKVQTAGYINGEYYQVNDTFICTEDSTSAATSSNVSTISTKWGVVEGNGDYLNIHGGTMYGTLSWANTTALPSSTAADYILVVDATTNGTTKYITKANFKTALSITDKTAFKLYTSTGNPGSTQKTDSTVISANSSTALSIKGGTNSFAIGNGTNYIVVPVNHGLTTKNLTVNGTNYAIYTSASSLPTIVAPNSLSNTGGYVLATNSDKSALEWVAQPAANVTTDAVVTTSSSGTTQISANQSNPYYNLLEGGAVARSIQFKAGTNMTISSTAAGVITFTATDTWRAIRVNSGSSNSVGTATSTKAMNFASSNLNIGYLAAGTSSGQSGSADYFTINIEAKDWVGATNSAAGTAGYMPGATSANRNKFLRGDGTWVDLSASNHSHTLSIATDSGTNQITLAASTKYKLTAGGSTYVFTTPPNTWRNIYTGGTSRIGTGASTKAMNFAATGNLSISYLASGTSSGQSGSADYFTIRINANANAVGTAGYVAAPTAADNKNQVWMTNSSGEPAWRALDLSATVTELVSVEKTLVVTSWTTMKAINTLSAGTYAIQISSGTLYASGIFTACHGTDAIIDEIPLHVSDTGNTWRPYARVSGKNLQMTTSETTGVARTYTIKILKLI